MAKSLIFKNTKIFIAIFLLFIFVFSINICFAAADLRDAFGKGSPLEKAAGTDNGAGYNTTVTGPEGIISQVITTALTFVGVVFLGLAIYAGYNWMTAQGEEEKVTKAKDTLTAAIIGLVIVIAAYAISYYVIDVLGGKALKPTTNTAPVAK